jgi:hypothetical protein
MSVITNFFGNLALRVNKENNLSDVTWSMCQASEAFCGLFLRFFFPVVEFNDIRRFEREVSNNDSRVDFAIDNGCTTYLIECKINDQNHHFEQYTNAYGIPPERLGYIVNYNMKQEGFDVKTWEQLYDYLEKNPPDNESEKILFEAYLEYLKGVCGIIKITKKMDLQGIHSLYGFNQVLKSLINRETGNFSLSYCSRDFKEEYIGYKFEVTSPDKETIWLNMGIWYKYEKPIITIGVWKQEGWGKPFYDAIKDMKQPQIYAKDASEDDGCYYFYASKQFYKEFSDAITVDEQKGVLQRFMDEVLNLYIGV